MHPAAEQERQRWLLPVILVAVVVAAAAAMVARELYATVAVERQAQPAPILPSAGTIPISAQPGPRDVRATQDATGHPLYETVRQLLQTYFDAINGKNYARWKTTVTDARVKDMPEDTWRAAYRTTQDGSIVVYRIETGPVSSARVLLTFVSKQDPADAPLELPAECIRWNVIFPLADVEGEWRIDAGPTGASPQHDRC
ncbi:hypothetical protein [Actinokineospora globicatena]|uniref:hypothetical protein n=1 Tax=Actinokineospora globicatena TaxID=103729 RepID=UPI0020A40CDD|nr:hypothetical protein [Actinokineospora globicatena]MCP2305373.1 hypothetical protein [Actinokineospora globicatena]GLW80850.1 hypothetical protein Aglo01_53310 [Actinokineospora globicatena]GLW87677.1 hypothetical protein Aglo02_53160 [Actinokineospora globicatena]